ncbi:MAG: hypothetical protein HAW66_10600 [Shewanella sp.]|nr:hypothetical protein [Shewanella sp.]
MDKHSLTHELHSPEEYEPRAKWKNPYRGMIRLWCYDIGSISFLATALMAVIIALSALAFDKPDVFTLLYSVSINCVFATIAWQINRMRSIESIQLIPNLFNYLLKQAFSLALVNVSLGMAITWMFVGIEPISRLLIATAVGLSFVRLCILSPKLFYAAGFLFVIPAVLGDTDIAIPQPWLILFNLIIAFELARCLLNVKWSPDAHNVYKASCEMGMFSVPNVGGRWIQRLQKYLHPTSFFMGNALSAILVLLIASFFVLEGANQLFGLHFPTLALLSQMLVITCAIVHWTRIQRFKAFELLYLLPTHSGLQELINQFMRGQRRLLAIITVCIALLAALTSLWIPELSKVDVIHITLSTYWGAALALGLGSMCQKVWQISLSMFVVAGQSLWLGMGIKHMSNGGDESLWMMGNVILLMLAEVALWIGKRQLWKQMK